MSTKSCLVFREFRNDGFVLLAVERSSESFSGDVVFREKQQVYLERIPEARGLLKQLSLESEHRTRNSLPSKSSDNISIGKGDSSSPNQFAGMKSGTLVGNYKLLEPIGEGDMGSVRSAIRFQPVHRDVALKIIKSGLDSKEVIARFEAERQALAMMDHPNIARFLDAGTTGDDQPFFAMELVHGIPLNEYCDSKNSGQP